MTATIIPLHPDRYIPLRFETPPEEAWQMHDDFEDATIVLQFAQTMRNEVFQRGEPLSGAKRQTLTAMKYLIEDLGR